MALGDVAAAMAERVGLRTKGCYTFSETVLYLGIGENVMRDEIAAGRLRTVTPRGLRKKTYISVADVDRWLDETARENESDAPGEVPQGAEHKTQDSQVSCIG